MFDLGRRTQNPRMIAICDYGSPTAHDDIERSRNPNAQPLHAPCKRSIVLSLDEQVNVIAHD